MPWAQAYEFPLATPFVHTGAGDLLVDVAIDQGSLVFGAWVNTSPYMMDGWRPSRENRSEGSTLGHPHCVDSAWKSGLAFTIGNATSRAAASPQHPDPCSIDTPVLFFALSTRDAYHRWRSRQETR